MWKFKLDAYMRSACGDAAASPQDFTTSASGSELLYRVSQAEECRLPGVHQVPLEDDCQAMDYTQAVSRCGQARQPSFLFLLNQYDVEVTKDDILLGVGLVRAQEERERVCEV
jgi:hypothetical protein